MQTENGIKMAITIEKGYMRAVARPSEKLISKLKSLGWKPGQTVYFDRGNLEVRFFDTKDELSSFIENKNSGLFTADDLSWDSMADIELQLDQYEDLNL
jgi:hypothetical protein